MENHEREYSGWCPTQLLPWIQNQDLKKLVVFGIGMILVAGALTYLKNELIDPIIDYGNTIGWCPV